MDSLFEFFLYLQGPLPYVAAFAVLLACGLGIPIPEDITLFVMGYLSYIGVTDFRTSVAVCFVGVLIGDVIIYWVGLHYGTRLTRQAPFARVFRPDRMKRVKELFHRWGNKLIFAARFMPGLRAPTYFSAGTLHLPFRTFISYDGLAALVSVPLLVGVVYYFGDHVDYVIQIARKVQHGIVLLIASAIALLVAKHFLFRSREKATS